MRVRKINLDYILCVVFYHFVFKQGVQQLTLSEECSKIGGDIAIVEEFYGFPEEDTDDGKSLSHKENVKWEKIKFQVDHLEFLWMKSILSDLNKQLNSLKACCRLDNSEAIAYIEVAPLEGAAEVKNWPVDVDDAINKTRSLFLKVSVTTPDSIKTETCQHVHDTIGSALNVEIHGNTIIFGGEKSVVVQMENSIKKFIAEFQIQKEEKSYSAAQVHFLSQALQNKLSVHKIIGFEFNVAEKKISLTANSHDRSTFWHVVNDELQNYKEKTCLISTNLGRILKTREGIRKIEEHFVAPQVFFYLEQMAEGYKLYFMSSTVGKGSLKKTKEKFKNYFEEKRKQLTKAQMHGCNDVQWKDFAKNLEQKHFVSIQVDISSIAVIISGEKILVSDIMSKINTFFMDNFSVTLNLTLSYHKWKVINLHFKEKFEAIRRDFSTVSISVPPTENKIGLPASIEIRGDKSVAESAKHRVEAIMREVCHKEDQMSNIPTARQLKDKMQDRLKILENEKHASIDISIIKEPSTTLKAEKQPALPPKHVCLATLSNEIRMSVYQGSFTNHDCAVDIIVNFVSLSPSESHANLSDLMSITNGNVIVDELKSKLRHTHQKAGNTEKTNNVGVLKCRSLWHFLLGEWESDRKRESKLLGKFLEKLFNEAIAYRTILLTTACSKPLHYPPEIFAKKLIESLQTLSGSPDLSVIIYVNNFTEASDFIKQLRDPSNNCRLAQNDPVSSSTRKNTEKTSKATKKPAIKKKSLETDKNLDKYIIVEKGDMIKKKVRVYKCTQGRSCFMRGSTII